MKKTYLRIYLFIGFLFSIFFMILFIYSKNLMLEFAIKEKEKELDNILLYHKALHKYVENIQKPVIYTLKKEGKLYGEFFDPKVLSFTYIARHVQQFANEIRQKDSNSSYYYKLASNNPRNLLNRANAIERDLLQKFNAKEITKVKEIIIEDNKPNLYYAMPIAPNKASCMRCHGNPKDAPIEMVKHYGNRNGFYEKLGEIRAIISLKMPLEKELNKAQSYYQKIMALATILALIIYLTIGYFFTILSKKDKIITKKNEELEILATHDPLTKIYNRLMFDQNLQMLIENQNGFVLALFDIDHFKAINDQHGHDIGDKVLQELTQQIQSILRKKDMLFRVGGEEFAIILKECPLQDALTIIERIRIQIASTTFVNNIHFTLSFGVEQYNKHQAALEIYKCADIALYQAKEGGRNRVVYL